MAKKDSNSNTEKVVKEIEAKKKEYKPKSVTEEVVVEKEEAVVVKQDRPVVTELKHGTKRIDW